MIKVDIFQEDWQIALAIITPLATIFASVIAIYGMHSTRRAYREEEERRNQERLSMEADRVLADIAGWVQDVARCDTVARTSTWEERDADIVPNNKSRREYSTLVTYLEDMSTRTAFAKAISKNKLIKDPLEQRMIDITSELDELLEDAKTLFERLKSSSQPTTEELDTSRKLRATFKEHCDNLIEELASIREERVFNPLTDV